MQIIVVGMHRSGTSTVTRALNMLGAYCGGEGAFTAPNQENPKGFWERKDVRAINDALITSLGCEWNRMRGFRMNLVSHDEKGRLMSQAARVVLELDAHRPWAIKEPRFCFTLPFWLSLMEVPVVLNVFRHPREVALSLQSRNGIPVEVGLAMWEMYVLEQIRQSANLRACQVLHHEVLHDPSTAIGALHSELTALGVRRLEMPSVLELNSFFDKSLYRARQGDRDSATGISSEQAAMWDAILRKDLASLSGRGLSGGAREILDSYEAEDRRASGLFAAQKQVAGAAGKISDLETKLTAQTAQFNTALRELVAGQQALQKGVEETSIRCGEAVRLSGIASDQPVLRKSLEESHRRLEVDLSTKLTQTAERHALELDKISQRLLAVEGAARKMGEQLNDPAHLKHTLDSTEKLFRQLNQRLDKDVERIAGQLAEKDAATRNEQSGVIEEALADLTSSIQAQIALGDNALDSLSMAAEAAEKFERSLTYRVGRTLLAPLSWIRPQATALQFIKQLARQESLRKSRFAEPIDAAMLRLQRHAVPDGAMNRGAMNRSVAQQAAINRQVLPSAQLGIVILNLDGAGLLENLFASLAKCPPSVSVLIAVTDHASSDHSREVLTRWSERLPISVHYAKENHSFSYSNNRWAEQLSGCEYLLFLNNDIVFHDNVIDRMARCLVDPTVGVVGIDQLDSPGPSGQSTWHHRGIAFNWDGDYAFWRPFNIKQADLSSDWPVREVAAVTGSVMLVRRADFLAIGGFDEGYCYGYEDVDLCLALQQQLGKRVVCVASDRVEHADGATRGKMPKDVVRPQRLANIERLRTRFSSTLNRLQRAAMAEGRSLSSEPLRVAFAVTETGESAVAGDLFTAMELGSSLQREFGWMVEYRPRGEEWYSLQGVDVVVAMVDAFDPRQIKSSHPALLRIAWARNWFERWCSREGSDGYDLVLASSTLSADYIAQRIGQPSRVLRIGANTTRFSLEQRKPTAELDYVFTGSNWNAARDIVAAIGALPDRFRGAVYGKGWADVPEIAHLDRGFRPYAELPDVYRNAKILVDDANHVTKPWGSVNSRVFDGLAAGCLVITNAELASQDAFEGELPVYHSPSHLQELISHFLEHPAERQALQDRLRDRVLRSHSYQRRAHEFAGHLRHHFSRLRRIAIKLPVPKRDVAQEWGDFHFAESLAKQLRRLGHRVRLDFLAEWNREKDEGDDIVLVLRGLSEYQPRPETVNLLWLISHPDKVAPGELERFDHVFVASESHARKLAGELAVPVSCLLQCTDPERFHPLPVEQHVSEGADALFVGNSRNVMRRIVSDAIEAGITPAIYGSRWENLVDPSLIHRQNIPNEALCAHYAGAAVLLNDHWPDMAAKGFLSNRLFDAVASGARVVSDYCTGMEQVFGDAIVTYDTSADLPAAIRKAASSEQRQSVQKIQREVLEKHTFGARAEALMARAEAILVLKAGRPENSAAVCGSAEISNQTAEQPHPL